MTTIDTRLAKGSAVVQTEVTLDWSGVPQATIQELAERSVIISLQRVYRESGKIPAKDTVKVADFLSGKGRPDKVITPEKILATASTMSEEDKKKLLALLTAKPEPKK